MTVIVPRPAQTIAELRRSAGAAAVFYPRTVGGLAANLFGLPLQVVEHFDDVALVAALTVADGDAHAAMAFHVTSTSRVLAACTKGADAPFATRKEGDFVFLEPNGKALRQPELPATVAVVDSYLVAADSVDGARTLGPYLTRTLSREPMPSAALVAEIRKPAMAELASAAKGATQWITERLPPAFASVVGEPTAHIDGLAQAVDGGTLTVELDRTAVTLTAALRGEAPITQAPSVADPRTLPTLPDNVMLSATWTEDRPARAKTASARAQRVSDRVQASLGDTWDDGEALVKSLIALDEGRGATTTMALACTGIGFTGLATGAIDDQRKVDEALKSVVGMLNHPAVKAKEKDAAFTVRAKRTRILEVEDDLWRIRLLPAPKDNERPEEIDLLALVRDNVFFASAGRETVGAMQHLTAPDPEASLSRHPVVTALVDRAAPRAVLFVLADPPAINACLRGKPGDATPAPTTFSVTPDENKVRIVLRADRALLAAPAWR